MRHAGLPKYPNPRSNILPSCICNSYSWRYQTTKSCSKSFSIEAASIPCGYVSYEQPLTKSVAEKNGIQLSFPASSNLYIDLVAPENDGGVHIEECRWKCGQGGPRPLARGLISPPYDFGLLLPPPNFQNFLRPCSGASGLCS